MLVAVMLTAFFNRTNACSWDDMDANYFNLFAQEIMADPRYRPFLLTLENRYFPSEALRNGNIEEWQNYLGLGYDDTRYLVFEAQRDDIQNLTKGKPVSDKKLAFATPEFAQRHKQTLLYIAYAKYLEPYMRIVPDETDDEYGYWAYADDYEHNAGDLDYDKVKTVLTRSWNAESDKELKLRYGYQLVRLAHYTRRFREAVQLFDQYVQPLGLKTEMYYYALSQKAGALRGMGQTEQANREFVRVFANSSDLKVTAYGSLTLGWNNDINFADFVKGAADDNERNDIYFMMGYSEFNNPTNEIAKIVANNPDAIQAKVLMVRAVNLIERNLLGEYYNRNAIEKVRYPFVRQEDEAEFRPFMNQTINLCDKQCNAASDKNFWHLASSYLHFLNQDFDVASESLSRVKSSDSLYMATVNDLTAYIDICRQPRLTAKVENDLFDKYNGIITSGGFIDHVLTNRYAMQGEKAKSFLVMNHLKDIEYNLHEPLLDEIQSFLKKKNKTSLEAYLVKTATSDMANPDKYLAYAKGVIRLTQGDLEDAKSFFSQQTRLKVSKRIFGHNIRVRYSAKETQIMRNDYIDEFAFIRDNMTEAEVTEALMQLQSIGEKNQGDLSAKAYYLMANFYYNVSLTGYFRHYLRFDNNNAYCYDKYSFDSQLYQNTLPLSVLYLDKAARTANDLELKAHIAFAAAKNMQQELESRVDRWDYKKVFSPEQFEAFEQYQGTDYYSDVITNCMYFSAFHNRR